jgi:hypothetical protein
MPPLSLRLRSDYLVPGIPAHRVSLSLSPPLGPTGGRISFDPNVCTLDQFGEPTMCTLMAAIPRSITLTTLAEDDDQVLYDIAYEAAGFPPLGAGPKVRLVMLKHPTTPLQCPARLLVFDADDHLAHIVHLHRVPSLALPHPVIPA